MASLKPGNTHRVLGRRFDSKKQERVWWSPQTSKQYMAESKCVDDAFARTAVPEVPGKKIDGEIWFEDNARIDLGVKLAFKVSSRDLNAIITCCFKAYKKIAKPNPPTVPGFKYTPEQAFFVSFVAVRSYRTSFCSFLVCFRRVAAFRQSRS